MGFRTNKSAWANMTNEELVRVQSSFLDYMMAHEEEMTVADAEEHWNRFKELGEYIDSRKDDTKKIYTVTFTETLVHKFEVCASSEEEAESEFLRMMCEGECDFSDGSVVDSEYRVDEE